MLSEQTGWTVSLVEEAQLPFLGLAWSPSTRTQSGAPHGSGASHRRFYSTHVHPE